jgi:hypothetical protein
MLPYTCLPAIATSLLAQARRAGNNGMMEYWKVGFRKKIFSPTVDFQCLLKTNAATTPFPTIPVAVIPPFHCSTIPRVSEAN